MRAARDRVSISFRQNELVVLESALTDLKGDPIVDSLRERLMKGIAIVEARIRADREEHELSGA